MPTDTTVIDTLTEQGYRLSSVCLDPGDYKTESRFQVTVSRNGQAYSTEYRQGCGHRVWTQTRPKEPGQFDRPRPKGGRVQVPYRVTIHQERELTHFTAPRPPALDDVMYCLVADASGVRDGQTFEDWCADCGFDDDSIKARESFDACTECWRGLVRMGADLDALDELFQDF